MGLDIVGKLGRHLVGECNLDVVAWSLGYMGAWVDSDLYYSILRTRGMSLELYTFHPFHKFRVVFCPILKAINDQLSTRTSSTTYSNGATCQVSPQA
jgi:hypothetical protein